MFKKLFSAMILTFISILNFLSAAIDYEVRDINTLQTKTSHAIAINNEGQILGYYSIDGSPESKHFFLRNRDGTFYELPSKDINSGLFIKWQFLTEEGKAYGTFDLNTKIRAVCLWDYQNGCIKLGVLPGKEISAINNAGQILIKSVIENIDGKIFSSPAIWQNGNLTKLKGMNSNLGLESEESQGLDMNNSGDVEGTSLPYLVHKNEIYKQIHALIWSNGQVIDLHNEIPKFEPSSGTAINDLGEVLVKTGPNMTCFIRIDNANFPSFGGVTKKLNKKYICSERYIVDRNNIWTNLFEINNKIVNDKDSIWINAVKIIDINDHGEIIAQGKTIYGEEHIMLLTPKNLEND